MSIIRPPELSPEQQRRNAARRALRSMAKSPTLSDDSVHSVYVAVVAADWTDSDLRRSRRELQRLRRVLTDAATDLRHAGHLEEAIAIARQRDEISRLAGRAERLTEPDHATDSSDTRLARPIGSWHRAIGSRFMTAKERKRVLQPLLDDYRDEAHDLLAADPDASLLWVHVNHTWAFTIALFAAKAEPLLKAIGLTRKTFD